MHSSIAGLIAQVITTVLSRAGYAGGLCGLMAIESACIPLPSEIIIAVRGVYGFAWEDEPVSGSDGCGNRLQYRIEIGPRSAGMAGVRSPNAGAGFS